MSITLIENLSNEFFFEIFEYLDGCEIYQAFSNLNYHFQQLINSLFLLLKFNFYRLTSDNVYTNTYKQLLFNNKHQILSFHITLPLEKDDFLSSFSIDSSFDHLESLIIIDISENILLSLLANLYSLSRLFSLTIDTQHRINDLSDIYRLIFTLPKLKYIKCSSEIYVTCDLLSMATNEQFSNIEYFIIEHPFAFKELCTLISYVPQLRHLTFSGLTDEDINIKVIKSITLSNLTRLYIQIDEISADKLEIFINKLNAKLKVLSLGCTSEDIDYLNANRWENFILNNLPQLENFYFTYHAYFGDDDIPSMYFGIRDQFISSFWLQRQWTLETEIEFDTVQYSIRPYKKRWYEYDKQHIIINQYSKLIRLIIKDVSPEKWFKTLSINQYIDHILTVTKIYHLEIQETICFSKLCEILYNLPELDTLRIHSLSFSKTDYLSDEELDNVIVLLSKNHITKLYFEKMNEIEEIYLLMLAFLHINYLRIKCVNYMEAELLVKFILTLMKNESYHLIRLLCFSIPTADDKMVRKLEAIIIVKNLLWNCTIKRVVDNIYLYWK
ncbi:unnamed protein product [Rotaria sordida]|uniref:F-box domain-containing protein n=1 Tax=Rotaria sordida TaxID=392033 RepID=A0A813V832_9BILA|nr:unnamed protein product [Rotaria sordida]